MSGKRERADEHQGLELYPADEVACEREELEDLVVAADELLPADESFFSPDVTHRGHVQALEDDELVEEAAATLMSLAAALRGRVRIIRWSDVLPSRWARVWRALACVAAGAAAWLAARTPEFVFAVGVAVAALMWAAQDRIFPSTIRSDVRVVSGRNR